MNTIPDLPKKISTIKAKKAAFEDMKEYYKNMGLQIIYTTLKQLNEEKETYINTH